MLPKAQFFFFHVITVIETECPYCKISAKWKSQLIENTDPNRQLYAIVKFYRLQISLQSTDCVLFLFTHCFRSFIQTLKHNLTLFETVSIAKLDL